MKEVAEGMGTELGLVVEEEEEVEVVTEEVESPAVVRTARVKPGSEA